MQYDDLTIEKLTKEFEEKREGYEAFGKKIENLLNDILNKLSIKDFNIKSRAKDILSFKGKIQRKSYNNPLLDITDLAGIRVIVCYIDQIKLIEEQIIKEFDIDKDKSIDKSKLYEPNTFGYLSVHYIVSNNNIKQKENSWKIFNGMKAEIQIRTSLQDSWAVVSHSLYKSKNEVPSYLIRRLNRLAGLFEIADQEFCAIKELNEKYKNKLVLDFKQGKTDFIEINYYSLIEFINRSDIIIEAIKTAKYSGILSDESMQNEYYNRIDCSIIIDICKFFLINNIKELSQLLKENKNNNIKFFENISKGKVWKFTKAFILFLIIIKAKLDEFPKEILLKNYGWDNNTVNFILSEAKKCNNMI